MSVFPTIDPVCSRSAAAHGITTVVDARPRDLGGFTVGRVLPAEARRHVGPFVFFDHMGPADLAAGHGLDVRPHPHIGLATVTYLFDGEIVHRDSLGSHQPIRPGDVNWMTAGRGIVHSERTGPELRRTGSSRTVSSSGSGCRWRMRRPSPSFTITRRQPCRRWKSQERAFAFWPAVPSARHHRSTPSHRCSMPM